MNCDPTLTAAEFKVLHNSLCELDRIDDPRVAAVVERIRDQALKGAYEQDNAAFEESYDHYKAVQQQMDLSSIWSVYEVRDLYQPHPYAAAREICYRDHWGTDAVYETIPGPTWADLYTAADRCVQRSGDNHHVFIEGFYTVADQPHQLRLTTGS